MAEAEITCLAPKETGLGQPYQSGYRCDNRHSAHLARRQPDLPDNSGENLRSPALWMQREDQR